MDLPRTDQSHRLRKRWLIAGGIMLAMSGLAVAIARLPPAAATVERSSVWVDTVKRGDMLRQVQGIGTLVPEEISWLPARSAGRVDRILLHPGAAVKPEDVILVLSNPEVVQAAADADSQLKAGEADLAVFKVQLESQLLVAESMAAAAKADFEQAKLRAQVNEELFGKGLVAELELKLSRVTAQQTEARDAIERKRFAFAKASIAPQLAVKTAELDQLEAQARLRHEELGALSVRAGMAGVLQSVPVDIGAQVAAGTNLARVADPTHLKAQIRIAETQAKDIRLGLPAVVDTRNGVVEGRVSRIDPRVQDGTVTVDVTFDGDLPLGARPDLTVDGTIQLQRLKNVLYVGRPAFGQEMSVVQMFKLDAKGSQASRSLVRLGRSSVSAIEIVSGLQPGDQVILSDTTDHDDHDRIRLK